MHETRATSPGPSDPVDGERPSGPKLAGALDDGCGREPGQTTEGPDSPSSSGQGFLGHDPIGLALVRGSAGVYKEGVGGSIAHADRMGMKLQECFTLF